LNYGYSDNDATISIYIWYKVVNGATLDDIKDISIISEITYPNNTPTPHLISQNFSIKFVQKQSDNILPYSDLPTASFSTTNNILDMFNSQIDFKFISNIDATTEMVITPFNEMDDSSQLKMCSIEPIILSRFLVTEKCLKDVTTISYKSSQANTDVQDVLVAKFDTFRYFNPIPIVDNVKSR
jgi:hypothetical protein